MFLSLASNVPPNISIPPVVLKSSESVKLPAPIMVRNEFNVTPAVVTVFPAVGLVK